ncbi:hypothetical protein XANCAGTX0491_004924 [Xanthoria calcicola]
MPEVTLRLLPQSQFYFWKPSYNDQVSQVIHDKTVDGTVKRLSKHDITAMALNEIAADRKRGFFWYFKSRAEWLKSPMEALCPKSRVSPRPRADYPSLCYADYRWTDAAVTAFFETSHRSRYLACNGLINLGARDDAVYPIQYICDARMPLYATSPATLVVFANSKSFYIGDSPTIEQLVGLWSQKTRPKDPDLPLRLDRTPYLWKETSQGQTHTLSRLAVPGIEQLYHRIVQYCNSTPGRNDGISPVTVQKLRATFPRPPSSELGIPLGVPLPETGEDAEERRRGAPHDFANPPSRRGTRLTRAVVDSDQEMLEE